MDCIYLIEVNTSDVKEKNDLFVFPIYGFKFELKHKKLYGITIGIKFYLYINIIMKLETNWKKKIFFFFYIYMIFVIIPLFL